MRRIFNIANLLGVALVLSIVATLGYFRITTDIDKRPRMRTLTLRRRGARPSIEPLDGKTAVAAALHPESLVIAANVLLPHVADSIFPDAVTSRDSKAACGCGPDRPLPESLAALGDGWLQRAAHRRWRAARCGATALDQRPESFFAVGRTILYALRAAWLALRLEAGPRMASLLARISELQQGLSRADVLRLREPTSEGGRCVWRTVGTDGWERAPSYQEQQQLIEGGVWREQPREIVTGEEACEGRGHGKAACLAVGCCGYDETQRPEP